MRDPSLLAFLRAPCDPGKVNGMIFTNIRQRNSVPPPTSDSPAQDTTDRSTQAAGEEGSAGIVQSSPIHVTVARPGSPPIASPVDTCVLQMMNQVAIPAAVGRLLDRAEVRGKERDQYQDLAPSLWDAMGVNMPENEEGMLALVRDCAANAGCGSLDQGLLLSVAGIVARFRKHSLNLSEHGRFGHSCGGA